MPYKNNKDKAAQMRRYRRRHASAFGQLLKEKLAIEAYKPFYFRVWRDANCKVIELHVGTDKNQLTNPKLGIYPANEVWECKLTEESVNVRHEEGLEGSKNLEDFIRKVKDKSARLLYERFRKMLPEDELEAVILLGRVDGERVEAIVPVEDRARFTQHFPIYFRRKGTVWYRIVNGQAVPIKLHMVGSMPEWLGSQAEKLAALESWMTKEIVEGYKERV